MNGYSDLQQTHATAPHKIESSWSILQSWILLCIYTTPTRAPPLPDFLRMEASSGKKIILFYFTMYVMSITVYTTLHLFGLLDVPPTVLVPGIWTFPTFIKDKNNFLVSLHLFNGDASLWYWTARGTCRRRFKKQLKLDIFVVVQPNGGMYCFTVCIERRIKR